MDEEFRIEYVDKPQESAWGIIGVAINDYNTQQAGDDEAKILCYVLKGADELIVGGVIAQIYWDWLYVDLMWVKEELRGHGYGHRLLTQLEEEARQRGARYAFLDTFSFQAPKFYEKHGYQVFGELNNFPAGHQRYYLTKQL
jgi:ribosomal protein S18 acetylase RimI-like enzyme